MGYERTPEIREKMRWAQTGKKASAETRRKMSKSHTGLFSQEKHPLWTGDDATDEAGRKRARRIFPNVEPCERCGANPQDTQIYRHHKDENTKNNSPDNIEFLCGSCHMKHHRVHEKRWGR